jgi:hypothetical protein
VYEDISFRIQTAARSHFDSPNLSPCAIEKLGPKGILVDYRIDCPTRLSQRGKRGLRLPANPIGLRFALSGPGFGAAIAPTSEIRSSYSSLMRWRSLDSVRMPNFAAKSGLGL